MPKPSLGLFLTAVLVIAVYIAFFTSVKRRKELLFGVRFVYYLFFIAACVIFIWGIIGIITTNLIK